MKIVYVVETFQKSVGYIDNCLPVALAEDGGDVLVLTAGLPPYFFLKNSSFEGASRESIDVCRVALGKGFYTLKCLGFRWIGKRICLRGLWGELKEFKPDVVVVRGLSSIVVAQLALFKPIFGYKLVASTGQAYSAVRDIVNSGFLVRTKFFLTRFVPGWVFSKAFDSCIGSTDDCVDLAVDWYGVSRSKCFHVPLGVDTNLFHPVRGDADFAEKNKLRSSLGISESAFVVIWTGRMVPGKLIHLLAEAMELMASKGHEVVGLFVGDGVEKSKLAGFKHSKLVSFVEWAKLPAYYRAADVACWPKSITTSTLDAAACGLPIVMSDQEKATERWMGYGRAYNEGSLDSLVSVLESLMDKDLRLSLGGFGSSKMESDYSWRRIAQRTVKFF